MSRLWTISLVGTLMATSLLSSGCCIGAPGGRGFYTYINEFMENQVACMRDRVWARRAFHLRYGDCERIHAPQFRDGFLCGYNSICDGGTGEVPALPPEKYWGVQYRSQEGLEMQNTWFEGYELGAAAAKQDGLMTFNEIQVSKDVVQAIEQAKDMEMMRSGVEKMYVVDMAPVKDASAITESSARQETYPDSGTTQPLHPMAMPQREAASERQSTIPLHAIPADVPLNSQFQEQR